MRTAVFYEALESAGLPERRSAGAPDRRTAETTST